MLNHRSRDPVAPEVSSAHRDTPTRSPFQVAPSAAERVDRGIEGSRKRTNQQRGGSNTDPCPCGRFPRSLRLLSMTIHNSTLLWLRNAVEDVVTEVHRATPRLGLPLQILCETPGASDVLRFPIAQNPRERFGSRRRPRGAAGPTERWGCPFSLGGRGGYRVDLRTRPHPLPLSVVDAALGRARVRTALRHRAWLSRCRPHAPGQQVATGRRPAVPAQA